ncbi:Eco57I restriction-modification methylase domain-containing protein [Frigoribacterium sp. 2-23]|uniref:Eco57I restriction-modification methylase domain-containing protein n=1 Tax=Frigoribacterium sp. 2-23 TaxID=3415006 RepID=UPI003C6FCEF6
MLEPSAGDGAFVRGLARAGLATSVAHVEAIELLEGEAQKVAHVMNSTGVPGRVVHENVLQWAQGQEADFDVLLANPPYVRFQFVSDEDKQRARAITENLGAAGPSVSNLWIPVLLLALSKLRAGGAFSVILPTEFLTGISASVVRNWLVRNTSNLTIDLFKPGSFPAVLQEVLVLSGRREADPVIHGSEVSFHDHNGGTRSWSHLIDSGGGTWTNYLLSPSQNEAIRAVHAHANVRPLRDVARFSVSTVTGANGYFCVGAGELDDFDLWDWAVPLLPRSRHAAGLDFEADEHRALSASGQTAWILSFSADRPSPETHAGARRFLAGGARDGIDQRFKCRVRSPWYRVPVVPAGDLMLSKRSNRYPRMIANHARVVTTDTIYRGQINAGAPVVADDLAAIFHNSLTMLSAEVEGRSFGGGVLELVPTEVSSLQVPIVPGFGTELKRLDEVARSLTDPEALVEATDEALSRVVPELEPSTMASLAEARNELVERRLQRSRPRFYEDGEGPARETNV